MAINGREDGALHDTAPVSCQVIGQQRVPVDSRHRLTGAGSAQSYGFTVGSYDPTRELVIDPGLEYSTFLGRVRALHTNEVRSAYYATRTFTVR